MGFYFRKSKSFGPFRLNFSKSGIGFSAGVKGARMSFGPKGTYVNLGSNGIYYRKKIGSKSSGRKDYNNSIPALPELDTTSISAVNIDTESMVETEFEHEFLSNIKRARTTNTLWIIAFIISYFLIVVSPLFLLVFIALIILRIVLKNYFRADINYEFDDDSKNEWEEFLSSIDLLKNSKKVWLIESRSDIYDLKHNAGAGETVKRSIIKSIKKVKPRKNNSAKIKCDNSIIQIVTEKCKIIFLPNLIVVINNKKVTGYSYENLNILSSTTRFIENSSSVVPRDSQIIDWTWQYVNRNGGPDMRYTNNPKMPICKYGTLKLFTKNGLSLEFYISNANISAVLEKSWNRYVAYITKVLSIKNAENQNSTNDINEEKNEIERIESHYIETETKRLKSYENIHSSNRLLNELLEYVSIEGELDE